MKTSLKLLMCLLITAICCNGVYAQKAEKAEGKLNGTWSYSAPDAPSGYEKGTVRFEKKDKRQTATATILGTEYALAEIKKNEAGKYATSLELDGYHVDITLDEGKETLTGLAVAGGMNIPVTLTKEKK